MRRNLGQFSLLNDSRLKLVNGGTGGNGVIPPGKDKTVERTVVLEGILKPINYKDKP